MLPRFDSHRRTGTTPPPRYSKVRLLSYLLSGASASLCYPENNQGVKARLTKFIDSERLYIAEVWDGALAMLTTFKSLGFSAAVNFPALGASNHYRSDKLEEVAMRLAKGMFVGALVLGGMFAVTSPASADFRHDRHELRQDRGELNRDRREYFRDLHTGADRRELSRDRRELWQDRRELGHDRRDVRNDRWDHRGWWR